MDADYTYTKPPVKDPTVAIVSSSPDRVIHNECVQTYDELPSPVRQRHSLANWTSVRLGDSPNRPTMNDRQTDQLTYHSLTDTNEQQNRESEQQNRENEQQDSESDDAQTMDLDLVYSDYSSEHVEDLR